jgi:enediyne biosynthesis protein E4
MRSAVLFFSFWKRLISILTKRALLRTLRLCIGLFLPLSLSAANNTLGQIPAPAAQTPDAQSKPSNQLSPVSAMGGSNTGGAHAAVFDAEHRPITAGGFTKTGPVLFEDIARQAGLTTWKHVMGTPEKQFII